MAVNDHHGHLHHSIMAPICMSTFFFSLQSILLGMLLILHRHCFYDVYQAVIKVGLRLTRRDTTRQVFTSPTAVDGAEGVADDNGVVGRSVGIAGVRSRLGEAEVIGVTVVVAVTSVDISSDDYKTAS